VPLFHVLINGINVVPEKLDLEMGRSKTVGRDGFS